MKITSRLAILATSFALPLLAAAQTVSGGIDTTKIKSYSDGIVYTINFIIVPVVMAVAFIVFLWGVYRYYILGADNETERATGHQFVLWGVIGFVVILSLWGLVNIVATTFGLPLGGGSPKPPTFTAP